MSSTIPSGRELIHLQKWIASNVRTNNIILRHSIDQRNNILNFDAVAFNAVQVTGTVYLTPELTGIINNTEPAQLPTRFEAFFYVPLSGYFSLGSISGDLTQQTAADAQGGLAGVKLQISVKNIINGEITVYIAPDTAGLCRAHFDLTTYDKTPDHDTGTPPGSVYNDDFLLFKLPQQV